MIYQKCPKCDGQGIVSKPPWVAGDQHQWCSSSTSFVCDVCNGKKVIIAPVQNECFSQEI
jgi:DnaJ-class molecular chaperone